jgi:uncharacterized phage protein (TIGR02218 family)
MLALTEALAETLAANDLVSVGLAIDITRVDDTVMRFAEVCEPTDIDGETYAPAEGLEVASIATQMNGGATSLDLTLAAAPTNTLINRDDVRDGVYDRARVVISLVDLQQPDSGLGVLFAGTIRQADFTDYGKVTFDCAGILDDAVALVVEHRTPTCRNEFGDERCGVNLDALGVATTVTSAAGFVVNVASAGGQPDAYFKLGIFEITSGAGKGRFYEIREHVGTTITTYLPLDVALQPGDALTLFPGCDLTNGPLGCQRWANCASMQADPFVPGQDARNINYREWGTPEPEPEAP